MTKGRYMIGVKRWMHHCPVAGMYVNPSLLMTYATGFMTLAWFSWMDFVGVPSNTIPLFRVLRRWISFRMFS